MRTGKVAAIAPTFSPDGRRIASFDFFPKNENAGDQNAVFVVNTDGTGLRRLTSRSRSSFDPDFSPDAKQIVYAESRDVANDIVQNRIAVISVNGKNRRTLTRYGGPD